jgi:putative flippase GtrA
MDAALTSGMHRQFAKYFISGVIALIAHLLVLTALVELLNVRPLVATGAGFMVGVCVNYVGQHAWVFRASGRHAVLFPRFAVVTFATFAANIALFHLLHDIIGLWYVAAQLVATAVIFVVNFLINRYYTFRPRPDGTA